jgi:hypothetical protein
MSLRRFVPLSFVLGALAGCTATHVDGPVDYRVTGGFSGGGDGTALHIELDGTVTRAASGGTQTAALDAVTLDDLHQKIVDAQFPALQPMYSCTCADDLTYNITVQLDGRTHTVAADSLAPIPGSLKTVIDTLQDIHQRPLDWH